MLHKLSKIVFISALLTCHTIAFAKTHTVEVLLVKIEAQNAPKEDRDKLYFTITEYPSKGEPKILREPTYPIHWLSRDLPKINSVKLWEGKIPDDSSMLLIFSLMLQEVPFFDPDDHLGSVQVKIVNQKNKITSTWGKPHFVDQPKIEQPNPLQPKYILLDPEDQYAVTFKLNILD